MSLLSDSGIRLIRDAKRAATLSSLAPYRDELVQDIISESRHLTLELQQLFSQKTMDGSVIPCSIHENALRQNKRVLLAYSLHRFQQLRRILWSLGIGSASVQLPDFITKQMSPTEMKMFKQYQQLISKYRESLGDFDLGSEDVPPKDVYIEVRVLKECGEILTQDGIVRLAKGSMHNLKRSHVEKLVRAGYVMHVS